MSQLRNWLNSGVELLTSFSILVKCCLSIYKQMQAINEIKNKTKPIETILTSVFIKVVVIVYQWLLITNTCTNILFSRLLSFILRILKSTSQYLYEEQVCLMREGRYFNCKKRYYITYDCLKRGKIIIVSKSLDNKNNS